MRGEFDGVPGEDDALWRALCQRVYPLRDATGVADGRRIFHQDLPFLTDMDLELDTLRARFRVCLEADFSDRMWLLERIDKVEYEQARRAEDAWPPRDPVEMPTRRRRDLDEDQSRAPRPDERDDEPQDRPWPHRASPRHRDEPMSAAEAVLAELQQIEREARLSDEARDQHPELDGRSAR